MSITADQLITYFVRLIVAFTALPIHEFAHGFVANKLGDPTAKSQGRLNINPFVHMDLFGTVCLVLTGFGWAKPVQINPRNFKNPKTGMAISAAAGPLSNLIVAFVLLIVEKTCLYLLYAGLNIEVMQWVLFILDIMVTVNIALAIFNLLPIPPLDGSRIAALFLPERLYFKIMRYENIIFIVLFAVLFFTPILDVPLSFLRSAVYDGLDFLTGFVDLIAKAIM